MELPTAPSGERIHRRKEDGRGKHGRVKAPRQGANQDLGLVFALQSEALPQGCFNTTWPCFNGKEESWAPGPAEGSPGWSLCLEPSTSGSRLSSVHRVVFCLCTGSLKTSGARMILIALVHPSNPSPHQCNVVYSLKCQQPQPKIKPKIHVEELPESSPERPGSACSIWKPPASPKALLKHQSCCGAAPKCPQQPQLTAVFGMYLTHHSISLQTCMAADFFLVRRGGGDWVFSVVLV